MTLLHEINWHEGLFLNPHHLQQFQREMFNGFKYLTKSLFSYPYGIIQCKVNIERLRDDGILEFETLMALMPSGYLVDITTNSLLPPITVDGIIKPGDTSTVLYLCLPIRTENSANLISANHASSFLGARLYSNNEEKHVDQNTGKNGKIISRYKLNPRIFTSDDKAEGYEKITVACIKKNEANNVVINPIFIPACFKISGSSVLMNIIRNIYLNLDGYVDRFSIELNSFLELNFQSKNLMYAIHKLRILSSYAIELKEIYLHHISSPYDVYKVLSKLIAELIAVTPGYTEKLNMTYDHEEQGEAFHEVEKIIMTLLNINVIQKNYDEFTFSMAENDDDLYSLVVPNDIVKKDYDYYISIKTKMSTLDLIKNVELGKNFKCIPSSMLRLQAVPGFTLRYVASLPNETTKEHNEFLFLINKQDTNLFEPFIQEKKIAVIDKLAGVGINIKTISLVVYHGTN
jgi:type VI secretion system protein ImpJ